MQKLLLITCALLCLNLSVSAKDKPSRTKHIPTTVELGDSLAKIYDLFSDRRETISQNYNFVTDSAQKDALYAQWQAIEIRCGNQMVAYCASVAPVCDTAIQFIYNLRTSVDKSIIENAYKTFKSKQRKLPYAQTLRAFLDTPQIEIGDPFFDFTATTHDSTSFKLSELVGEKSVILIFGGLGCMGNDMLTWLKMLYNKMGNSNIEIVSVSSAETLEQLRSEQSKYNIPWISMSDMLGDHSPAKVTYNVQATPTCVVIGKDGKVKNISIGVDEEIISNLINAK